MRVSASTNQPSEGLHVRKRMVAPLIVKGKKMDSEATMKRKLNFVLLMALGAAMLNVIAGAQSTTQLNDRDNAKSEYAIYNPSQSAAQLRQIDWDDHHRCDGDHDRDDHHCYWRGRDDDRYRAQYYYRGNGYYGNAPVYSQGGWYDRDGRWHADGWYDRKGKWHSDKHHGHGDDR